LIEVMQSITTLHQVSLSPTAEVSSQVRTQLEAAMRKNKLQTEEIDKLRDMDRVANKL